jgi:hypothetical protein
MSNNKLEEVEANKDSDSLFEYIIELQSEKLNRVTNVKTISLYTGYFTTLTFLIILTFRVSFTFSWFYLLPFCLTSILAFTTFLNMYLKLQDILHEEIEKLRNEEKSVNVGSILSYFSLNTSAVCLCVYFTLVALKLTETIVTEWNVIAIPLFILCGISLFYLIFIMPAFLTNRLYLELALIFIYFVSMFMFIVFLNLRLDKQINTPFKQIFVPLIISFSLNLGFCIFLVFANKDINNLKMKVMYMISIILFLIASVITPVKLDNELQMPGFTPVLLIFFAVLILVYDDITNLFIPSHEEEDVLDKAEKRV